MSLSQSELTRTPRQGWIQPTSAQPGSGCSPPAAPFPTHQQAGGLGTGLGAWFVHRGSSMWPVVQSQPFPGGFWGKEPVAAGTRHTGLLWPTGHRGCVGDAHVCEASSQAHACCEKGNKKSLPPPAAFSISFLITWHIHLIQASSFQVVSGGGRHSRNADLVCLPRQSKEKPSHNHFQTLKWLHCHYS